MKRTPLARKAPMHRKEPSCVASEHPRAKEKECAHCHNPFQPIRPMQKVCGPLCARRKVEADKKAERATDRAKREALKRVPELMSEAQDAFNAYIRERDRDKGCFVCDEPFDFTTGSLGGVMDAGHVRSRGAAGHLRFNEDNCHAECKHCNSAWGAKPHEIEAGAIRRIGQERYDVLKSDNTQHKWGRDELRQIRDTYRAKRKELERDKP